MRAAGGALFAALVTSVLTIAQPAGAAEAGAGGEAADPKAADEGMIDLDLPERLPVKTLIEYVSKRTGVNFLYDERVGNRKVTLRTPEQVPADALMTLLGTALRMKGLTIADTDVAGMKRIAAANTKLPAIARGPDGDKTKKPEEKPTARTRLFPLDHATAKQVRELVKPFLSSNMADVRPVPGHPMIAVTDYASNMGRIARLVKVADQPGPAVATRLVPVENRGAQSLAETVRELLAGRGKALGDRAKGETPSVLADPKTNRVAVVGPTERVERTVELIRELDGAVSVETRTYEFDVASPARVNDLIETMLEGAPRERHYRAATDAEARILIATAPPAIHERIERLREHLDQEDADTRSPIRFYELEHANAARVLQTLRSLGGGAGLRGASVGGVSAGDRPDADTAGDSAGGAAPDAGDAGSPGGGESGSRPGAGERKGGDGYSGGGVSLRGARITAHEPTNAVIVSAEPSMQPVYRALIDKLDKRRPQVLVEATIVLIDTTDRFTLGVEVRTEERADGGRLLNFTQFGLTTGDPNTGEIAISPGTGFNGALLNADTAELVIQALDSDSRAKVVSRPSVLVNDNATGTLSSENEEPFESVNASDTVATTSLGGFVTAGTSIEMTPQISEGEQLKLSYEVSLSSFEEGSATENLPPARQTNSLSSEATIPNGHTIVVGGLTRENLQRSVDRVPLIGEIPLVKHLASSRARDRTQSTLFVFIRPVILRDDKFRDLKALSDDALGRSGVEAGLPTSEPVSMR